VLDTARTQIAGTVSQSEIRNLPLNGRNLLDIALLVPGVSPTDVASTQMFAETSVVPGAGLSINSQRNFSNSFVVDGLSANDDAADLSGMPYSVDAVDQFQVVTSGGQAEFGRALGGYVNVVTRSGTNTTHGDAYEYGRDSAWNAANPLSGTTLPMHQNQFGGSAGGPIVRDRTFHFGNVEARRLDQAGLVTISSANVVAIDARLSAVGYPGSAIRDRHVPEPGRLDERHGQDRSRGGRDRSVHAALRPVRRFVGQLARRGRFRDRSAARTRSRRWRTFWRARTTMPASRRRSAPSVTKQLELDGRRATDDPRPSAWRAASAHSARRLVHKLLRERRVHRPVQAHV
jgi:hypothetical protein